MNIATTQYFQAANKLLASDWKTEDYKRWQAPGSTEWLFNINAAIKQWEILNGVDFWADLRYDE